MENIYDTEYSEVEAQNILQDSTEVLPLEGDAKEADGVQSVTIVDTGSDEVVLQLQVISNLIGIQISLQVFFLGCFFMVFFYKIIKNNLIKHFK